ncbi:MAG: hypothetical protein ABIJ47_06815 [Candidatus Bathyarchaeota archaeon]
MKDPSATRELRHEERPTRFRGIEKAGMRRFILTALAPLGDSLATACTLLMLNGLAWIGAGVYLNAPFGLVVTYAAMAILAVPTLATYALILLTLSLAYRVPLSLAFLYPDRRAEYLEEALP